MDSPAVINVFYVIVLIFFFIMIYWWWGVMSALTAIVIFVVIMFTIAIIAINAKYAVEQKIHKMKVKTEEKFNEIKDKINGVVKKIEGYVDITKDIVKEGLKEIVRERLFDNDD